MPKSNVTLNVTLELQHSEAASLDRQISGAVAENPRAVKGGGRDGPGQLHGLWRGSEVEWTPASGSPQLGGQGEVRTATIALHQLRSGERPARPSARPSGPQHAQLGGAGAMPAAGD